MNRNLMILIVEMERISMYTILAMRSVKKVTDQIIIRFPTAVLYTFWWDSVGSATFSIGKICIS